MGQQLSMQDLWEPRPSLMIERVDPYGPVLQGAADETLTLPRQGNVNPLAKIELHRHSDGRWMWSAGFSLLNGSGHSYKVGAKWGRFATTRSDALRGAVDELLAGLCGRESCRSIPQIIAWSGALV